MHQRSHPPRPVGVLFNPAALLVSLIWLVAIWAIMAGIIFAIASFFVRKAGNVIVQQTAA